MDVVSRDWGACGLAYLTGLPDGPQDFSRAAVLARARSLAADLGVRVGVDLDAATLLAGRAAQLGLRRAGRISAGGATRLLRARDGWCAITLSRSDDVDAVPALIECDVARDGTWPAVERWAGTQLADAAVERARLLGLPAAVLGEAAPARPVVRRIGAAIAPRPDGTRAGPRSFFDWMDGGKLSYAADFDDPAALRALLAVADVPAHDGRVWLRITGHGADGPVFCADAIADPLAGLHAALAAEALTRGGGELVDVAMAAVAAGYAALPRTASESDCVAVPPTVPAVCSVAAELGADNARVDRMVTERRLAPC